MVYTQEQMKKNDAIRKEYQKYLNIGQEFLYLSEQDCIDTGTTDMEIIEATEQGMIAYST